MVTRTYCIAETHDDQLKKLAKANAHLSEGALVRTALDRLFKDISTKRISVAKIIDGRTERRLESAKVDQPSKTKAKTTKAN